MKDVTTKNRIILATINNIEAYGIEAVTIRSIAKEAGITLSSVHYYFESKEVLVDAALNVAITDAFGDLDELWQQQRTDYKAALYSILFFLFDGAIQYPGITRAGLYPLFMHGKNDTLFISLLNDFLGKIANEVVKESNKDFDELKFKLIEVFSAVLFLGISTKAFYPFSNYDFVDLDSRKAFITRQIESL